MGIRSKPQQATPAANERAVEAFIGKGGGVMQGHTKAGKQPASSFACPTISSGALTPCARKESPRRRGTTGSLTR